MLEISADIVLVNALLFKKRVTIAEIKDLKRKLEDNIPNLYVDVSMGALIWAVQDSRPDIFEWPSASDFIRKREGFKLTKSYVNRYYNWRVTAKYRKRFVSIFQE